MPHRPRSLTDRLLLRAWIEPDHEQPLRVLIRHQRGVERTEEERAFADADRASSFVREWLLGLVRRWEGGEQPHGGAPPDDGRE